MVWPAVEPQLKPTLKPVIKESFLAISLRNTLSRGDKNFLFWSRGMGDFALCVKGKVDALCGNPSFYLEIRLMRGGHSQVGKVELGPYLRGKDDSKVV